MEIEIKEMYTSWAFSENEHEKCIKNRETYKWLKETFKISAQFLIDFNKLNPEDFDIIYSCVEKGYAHNTYKTIKNKPNLPIACLALIYDDGNLCFGYSIRNGNICIHTD